MAARGKGPIKNAGKDVKKSSQRFTTKRLAARNREGALPRRGSCTPSFRARRGGPELPWLTVRREFGLRFHFGRIERKVVIAHVPAVGSGLPLSVSLMALMTPTPRRRAVSMTDRTLA